ncbi:MAG: M50 family metallopeptidase [Shimia sp.]|uniref:M50 family metallopeptidase n=1 Tax=Shimia sp. TaxID=1954381 RepID=UPI0040586052
MRKLWTFFLGHWQLLGLTLAVALLWHTDFVLPLRVLTVFLHELSHAITVLATGGEVLSLTLNPNEGGLVMARGGSRFLSLSAGYLGTLVIGSALFLIALRTHWDRTVVGLFGIVTLLVAAFYVRDLFALAFVTGTGLAMLASERYFSLQINDMVLRTIGLTSMIYAPLDIFDDTIARAHLRSDARMLAEEFGGTTMMWGGMWLLISLAAIGLTLRFGLVRPSNIALRGPYLRSR